MRTETVLHLNELGRGLPGITPIWGAAMVEAALVCLASQNHVPGVELLTEGCTRQGYGLIWSSMSDPNQAIRAWADPEEATEYGATAIAVLLAKSETGYAVVQRSRKGTGFDYWMGDESDGPPFQRKAKLEISGILQVRGDYGAVRRAVRQEFSRRKSRLHDREFRYQRT